VGEEVKDGIVGAEPGGGGGVPGRVAAAENAVDCWENGGQVRRQWELN